MTAATTPAADAGAAGQRAGVVVRIADESTQLEQAQLIFDEVWPTEGTNVQGNLLRACVHAGGYLSLAYDGATAVGAALGFIGRHRVGESTGSWQAASGPPTTGPSTTEEWHTHLHSHMAGVLGDYRNRHIGTALKLHQRMWALDQGIDTIVWTFDPLVRRNARLNIGKLGVDVEGYEPNFYGSMTDAINAGDPTDRVFAWWRLASPRVHRAMAEGLAPIDTESLPSDGQDIRVVALPADIVALRGVDPSAALQWRLDVREGLMGAFAEGFTVIGVNNDGGYVLVRERT